MRYPKRFPIDITSSPLMGESKTSIKDHTEEESKTQDGQYNALDLRKYFIKISEYKFIDAAPLDQIELLSDEPKSFRDCTLAMMIGLPCSGKSTAAQRYATENPKKKFHLLGSFEIYEQIVSTIRMRYLRQNIVTLMEISNEILQKSLKIAATQKRNYILDQCNILLNPRIEKLDLFGEFHKIALVIVPADIEFKKRIQKKEKYCNKNHLLYPKPSPEIMKFMTKNFSFPGKEEFDEIQFLDLPEEEAKQTIQLASQLIEDHYTNANINIDLIDPPLTPSPIPVTTMPLPMINTQPRILTPINPIPISPTTMIPVQTQSMINPINLMNPVNIPNGKTTPDSFTYSSMTVIHPMMKPQPVLMQPQPNLVSNSPNQISMQLKNIPIQMNVNLQQPIAPSKTQMIPTMNTGLNPFQLQATQFQVKPIIQPQAQQPTNFTNGSVIKNQPLPMINTNLQMQGKKSTSNENNISPQNSINQYQQFQNLLQPASINFSLPGSNQKKK